MNAKLMWLLFLPVLLFFLVMFWLEVSMYSMAPEGQGGMSFWTEFKHTWYRSAYFYASLLISGFLLLVSFLHVKKKKKK